MAVQKPHPFACLDGADHTWMKVTEEDFDGHSRLEHWWCSKCGCLTQAVIDPQGVITATLDDQGAPYLAIPQIATPPSGA